MNYPRRPDPKANKGAFLHGRSFRKDGTTDSLWTEEVHAELVLMKHHRLGLNWTATGYGRRIPSPWMVYWRGRWRRVYVCQYSNGGTPYIGEWVVGRGAEITVQV